MFQVAKEEAVDIMIEFHLRTSLRTILASALVIVPAFSLANGKAFSRVAVLETNDARIQLQAGSTAPHMIALTSANGRAWRNEQEETLPRIVNINGAEIPVTWHIQPALCAANQRAVDFVYESAQPHLRLHWMWEARAQFGPFEHHISVDNLSGSEISLPMIHSLRLDWHLPADIQINNFYIEKGADTPSAQGTHLDAIADGYRWTGKSSTYAYPIAGESREIIPIEIVFLPSASQTGWYAGIEFSGRTRLALSRVGTHLNSVVGLNPDPGPFLTRVDAGATFETPTVFLGAFAGGADGAGNQLRPWVRAVLGNPITWNDPHYPLTVNNSWGSGMQVDEALALRMIDQSRELGLEMFHLDAGWFRGVGDWYPDPKKFPHGLAPIAAAAHANGLRFGIWVDWTQAGLDTQPGALNAHDPKVHDWLVSDVAPDWKPEEFKGQTADVGVPAAHDYFAHEVKRIVEDYHLDMLEHDGYLVAQGCIREDHPHLAPNRSTMRVHHDWASDFVVASNSTDVSYHAVRAYYDIYEKTRREHPGLLFEICNDGGRMVDFGSAAHGDYFSITDTYDPLSNRRAFYDASYVLPPAMLESYVEKWPVPTLANFHYMLRSGMMGWMSIMLDTTTWTAEQHRAAREAIALYQRALRPLIRDANLYHVSPRPDGVHWDGMEYWNPAQGKGAVFAFRGTIAGEASHRFQLAGLKPGGHYHLHFEDSTAPGREANGDELMKSGLLVNLPETLSSEVIFIEAE
jgi:hypothetical protein